MSFRWRVASPIPSNFAARTRFPPVASRVAERLVALAAREPDVTVRAQLACTARRLPPGRRQGRYRVRAHVSRLRPGIDAASLNRLADELEEEATVEKMRAAR